MASNITQPLICPVCGGTLTQSDLGSTYYCLVGHRFSSSELDVLLRLKLRQSLQVTLRQIQERNILRNLMVQGGLAPPHQPIDLEAEVQQVLARLTNSLPDEVK